MPLSSSLVRDPVLLFRYVVVIPPHFKARCHQNVHDGRGGGCG